MVTYFTWWYVQEPPALWRATKAIILKIFNSFSVSLLIRTLFAPWKRDVTYLENASLSDRFNIALQNLASRLVGFVVRLFTVSVGLILTVLTAIILLSVNFVWFLMPVIIIFLILNGLRILLLG